MKTPLNIFAGLKSVSWQILRIAEYWTAKRLPCERRSSHVSEDRKANVLLRDLKPREEMR